jgi:hypothetical protein
MEVKLRLRFHWIPAVVAMSVCAGACVAQYRVLPGALDARGLPTAPARICLAASVSGHCYAPPSDKFAFGLEPKAQTVGNINGEDLILFTASFSGGGSGRLTHFAILKQLSSDLVDVLPPVQLTNQSEYKVWSLPQFSNLPVLVTADYIWDIETEETHFSAHRYHIEVFVFDAQSGRYVQVLHYGTSKKYPGLDDVDAIAVLDAEKPAILAKLKKGLTN